MNWHAQVAAEFTRLGKTGDAGVVEEMADAPTHHQSAIFRSQLLRVCNAPADDVID